MQILDTEAWKVTHPKDAKGNNATIVFGDFNAAVAFRTGLWETSGFAGDRDFRALFQICPVVLYCEEQTGSGVTPSPGVTIQ
jgi:hypothetical protein